MLTSEPRKFNYSRVTGQFRVSNFSVIPVLGCMILSNTHKPAQCLPDSNTTFHTVKLYTIKPDKKGIPHFELTSTQRATTTFMVVGKRMMENSVRFKSVMAYDIMSCKKEVEGNITTYTLGIHSVMRGDDNLMFISLVGNKVVGMVESLTAQDILMKFE